MKHRWVLFYDGACPLCFKAQANIKKLIDPNIKLTVVNLHSEISINKGYNNNSVILEAENEIYQGYKAWLKILSSTKYKFLTHITLRPFFIILYGIISKNRKLISKLLS